MTVAIVDYGSGNLRSAAKAFERASREGGQDEPILVTSDPDDVLKASRIVLPGVGAFADCKRGLAALPGMIEALEEAALKKGRPFLGICVGMQLMAEHGHEHGVHEGLGWIAGDVVPLSPGDLGLKIPHMGWNNIHMHGSPHALVEDIDEGADVYFVHSYALACRSRSDVVASTRYGTEVTAMVARGNLAGTQFHPEKSQHVGLKIISNFLSWAP
ncbi:MAG: imidazole glycerol phosphate synthase subunit HisH [Rhodospirillales bacterium]|nr:imidazole glycerol phosphate synthase subunit HisH [Rhodospirillales bacterium]